MRSTEAKTRAPRGRLATFLQTTALTCLVVVPSGCASDATGGDSRSAAAVRLCEGAAENSCALAFKCLNDVERADKGYGYSSEAVCASELKRIDACSSWTAAKACDAPADFSPAEVSGCLDQQAALPCDVVRNNGAALACNRVCGGFEPTPDAADGTDTSESETVATATSADGTTHETAQETTVDAPDTAPPPTLTAVIVSDEDTFDGQCRSNSGADGADIDAVILSDEHDNNLGGFVSATLHPGTRCNVTKTNIQAVKGAPDGTLTTGTVSLGGGYVAGAFEGDVYIRQGYTISVYEIGDAACTAAGFNSSNCIGDEPYEVFVADTMNCAGAHAVCALKVASTSGGDSNTFVDLTGF